METTTAKIDNVFVKNLNDGRSIYRTITEEREYTTFKKALAEQAKALIDQKATIGYTMKPGNPKEGGGNWPDNYYLESVAPAAQTNGNVNVDGFTIDTSAAEKEMRIMREAALERALLSLQYFEPAERTRQTIMTLCDEYVAYFATGEWGTGGSMSASDPADDIPF